MTLEEIKVQLDSLIENAQSFLEPDDPDAIWLDDIVACTVAQTILTALQEQGCNTLSDALDWIRDKQE